jgi:CMP-N-acetylneuraminic acid synthetase
MVSELFTNIVIATDDSKYKPMAGEVYLRPDVDDDQTLAEFMRSYIIDTKYDSKYICMLYACSPFVSRGILREAYSFLDNNGFKVVFVAGEGSEKPAGMLWYAEVESFMNSTDANPFLPAENFGVYTVEDWRGIDIDYSKDWEKAELLYRKYLL